MKVLSDPGQWFIAIPLPIIPGSVDFVKYRKLLDRIDELLQFSSIEQEFAEHAVAYVEAQSQCKLKPAVRLRHMRHASRMLRCNIARSLSQEDYRDFSIHLADSHLLREFCRYNGPSAPKKTASKSTLQRGATAYDEAIVSQLVRCLIEKASRKDGAICGEGGLVTPLDTKVILMDTTCIELNIHFPTDWVLLRDAIKSLVRAIESIRRRGLFHRIQEPKSLVSRVNKLSMQMTQASQRGGGDRKEKKRILRALKKLAKAVGRHGARYREVLTRRWQETDLSQGNMEQIVKRIDNVLEKLPHAIFQAHERIIGERSVENEKKLLSLYEPHAKVYKRKKAASDVEFGLQLLLGETMDGVISDWELVKEAPLNDTKHIARYLQRFQELPEALRPEILVADRGFDSQHNGETLTAQGIKNMICPKDPKQLEKKMGQVRFAAYQRRRAQTEGRIGIMKHCFIGRRMPAKGYDKQRLHVAWAVLAHNLWVIARLPNRRDSDEEEKKLRRA